MIVLIHNGQKAISVTDRNTWKAIAVNARILSEILIELAQKFSGRKLIWVHQEISELVDFNFIRSQKNAHTLLSFAVAHPYILNEELGFVDQSVFLTVNQAVCYPTYLMSADVGCITSNTLLHFASHIPAYSDFNLFLAVLAKLGMPKGLLCYSEPRLIQSKGNNVELRFSKNQKFTYSFIAATKSKAWLLLYEFQRLIYTKSISPFYLLNALGQKQIDTSSIQYLPKTEVKESFNFTIQSIDVVIPTIGRKAVLYQTLRDLAAQSVTPKTVLLVEQNPDLGTFSELDYLQTENWPFEIKHTFTHKTGVCNARNLALGQITSEWVFLADDDLRISSDFLETALQFIEQTKPEAFTVSCLQKDEQEHVKSVIQWEAFGSGCSFVKASVIKDIRFDTAFEYGFGEDADFGMQLRNSGADVLYNPFLKLIHLKAPSGGFRTQLKKPWEYEEIQPKPVPTVLAFFLKHKRESQILGYKTLLFFKFYKNQSVRNPFSYLRQMQKRWSLSKYWAQKLLSEKQ